MLDHLRSDAVQALRELRTRPLVLVAVVLTLGAAIGMNLAMFGLVDRALLSPPRHLLQPERLFSLAFRAPGEGEGWSGMTTTSYVTYRTVRDGVKAFSGVAAWQNGPASVAIDGEQVPADTLLISGNYFDMLGSRPILGHGISAADEDEQTAAAVLSHRFWKAVYGGDAGVLGRRVTVQGVECTITGVMPRGFSGHSAASVDVWVPITAAMRAHPGWDQEPMRNIVSVVARLADGGSAAAAVTQTSAALQREVALTALNGAGISASTRRVALWLSGLSVLVVLIGLANSATLLLVRAARRRRDASIRVALGASRGRLVSVALIEALVVAVAGTGASLFMGYWLDEAVRRVLLPGVSESGGFQIRPLIAAGIAGTVTFVVAAAAGAWSLPSAVRTSDLKDQDGTGRQRLQQGLLVLQTGVCVVLLAGAGMFGRSLYRLMQQDFGMTLDHVLMVDFESGANPVAGQDQVLTDAMERIRSLPGVRSVAPYQSLPFGGHHIPPISVPGRAEPPNVDGQLPFLIAATPELFEILGIEVVEGRRFTAGDLRDRMVVIVNETMARVTWPGGSAVGKCIRAGFDPAFDPFTATGPPTASVSLPCREVIGVARDVRQRRVVPSDNEARLMQYYVPFSQVPGPPAGIGQGPTVSGLLVGAERNPASLAAPIRRLVTAGRGSGLPFVRVRPYLELLERQVEPWRLGAALLAMFSALALVVAALGLFAAFAHAVTLRRREMAIRVAIGATPSGVLRMVLREAAAVAAIGIALGTIAAFAGGRSLQSMLFGIVPSDPLVLGGSALGMLVVVVGATLDPARRAARANPNSLLRAE